jgi:hypothetical protein
VSWRLDFQPLTAMVWDCLSVELLLGLFDYWVNLVASHTSLANVTVATIACNDVCRKVGELVLPRTSCYIQ